MNKNNTKKQGIARTMIFPCKGGYMAVCLDFDIIEEGDTREELEESMKEAVIGYIENVCKNNLDDKLLNRHADKKYWKIYDSYLDMMKNSTKKSISANLKRSSLFTFPISNNCECFA
jgi:predicted RNase H-like HicB family nuclease